jgi:hypothetical protein
MSRPLMIGGAAVITAALVFGGGSRGGLLSDVVLQLLALPVLVMALWRPRTADHSCGTHPVDTNRANAGFFSTAAVPITILIGVLTLLVVQLAPGLGGFLRALPTGSVIAEALETSLPNAPLSVAPHLTWQALLSLIPPCAVFLATLRLTNSERRRLTLIMLAVGVLSVFIGLLQLGQGEASRLRFYDITNQQDAVGFFANRNHFSALLYCLTLFAAVWALDYARVLAGLTWERRFETAVFLPSLAMLTMLVVLVAAQGIARSRTGLLLTLVAMVGVLALALADRRAGAKSPAARSVGAQSVGIKSVGIKSVGAKSSSPSAAGSALSLRWVVVVVAVALVAVIDLALYGVLERFGADPLADPRLVFARNTITAAKMFMPFGAGVGTFVPVYGLFEQPGEALQGAYVNRAHNDFLEIWLESGVVGPVLAVLFVLWVLVRAVAVWWPRSSAAPDSVLNIDHALARAATLVIALLLAHSLTDYPLRTGALMVVFAFSAALLVAPPPEPVSAPTQDAGRGRASRSTAVSTQTRSRPAAEASAATNNPVAPAETPKPRERTRRMPPVVPGPVTNPVLEEANWPDVWRTPPKAGQARSWPTAATPAPVAPSAAPAAPQPTVPTLPNMQTEPPAKSPPTKGDV